MKWRDIFLLVIGMKTPFFCPSQDYSIIKNGMTLKVNTGPAHYIKRHNLNLRLRPIYIITLEHTTHLEQIDILAVVRAVRKNTEITDLTMSQNILNMNTGSTAQLTAIVTPTGAINKTVTWSSSNTSVATVSQSGLVTANAAGSCTITARSVADNTLTATCTITVTNVPVTSIRIVGWSDGDGLATGQTVQLTAIVEPANATNKSVIWTSNRTHVVTIDENGLATCVYQSPDNIGTNYSIITATAADGSGVSASVTMLCWSN